MKHTLETVTLAAMDAIMSGKPVNHEYTQEYIDSLPSMVERNAMTQAERAYHDLAHFADECSRWKRD